MASSYPTSQKTFTSKSSGDTIQASHVNDAQDEIVALEQGLLSGLSHTIKPATTNLYDLGSTTLKWRNLYLAGTIAGTGSVTLASTLAVTGQTTLGAFPSGYGSYPSTADNLIVQGAADIGLTFASDSGTLGTGDRTQTVAFGAAGINAADAWMRWSTATRALDWGTSATARLTLDLSGHLIFAAKAQRFYLYYTSATDHAALTTDTSGNVLVRTGTSAPATRLSVTYDGHTVPGVDDTSTLGTSALRWSRLSLANGLAATPALALGANTTGFYYDTSLSIARANLATGGVQTWSVRGSGSGTGYIATLHGGAFGTGLAGCYLQIGNNGSGFGAAGTLSLLAKDGTGYFLWVDGSGKLRIHTAPPVESGGTADTDGTIVGTQS